MATLLKPPIPEKPYFPSGGWNPDAQGLSIKEEECADSLNMRISRREAFVRGGYRRLCYNSLGANPALEFHNYKSPTGVETTFAFTKNCIYKNTTTSWVYAIPFAAKDTCESATNWGSAVGTAALDATRFHLGTGSIRVPSIPAAVTDTQRIVGKSNVTWDCSARTHISFWYSSDASTTVNAKINFYSAIDYTTLIESFTITLPVSSTCFRDVAVKMTTPAGFAAVKSFDITVNGNQTLGAVWNFNIDNINALDITATDVEFWKTTRFVDVTTGETVIAAGSNPPLFDEAEDDQASRLLYYYDTTNGWFSPLTTYRNVSLGDEDTTVNGPAIASTVVSTAVLACHDVTGFSKVVKGTVSIYTLEYGTLATASSVETGTGATAKYALIPTDSSKIQGGSNSFVYSNGDGWSLQFLTADYSGLDLYVLYTYKVSIAYKPRFVWSFHNRLLFGGTYESTTYYPWRIRASEIEDQDLFTDTNRWDLVDNDISPITAGEHLGFYLTIYKGDSIVKGSYIGGTSIFTFQTAWKSGTYAGRTVQAFRGRHYYMGRDDVHVWDGNTSESITLDTSNGQYRTREEIFKSLNQNQLMKCFGSLYSQFQEYWLWITKTGETYPSSVFVYSILLNIWYYFEFTATACTGVFHVETGATIDELIGTIDEQNWRYDDVSLEGTTQSLLIAPSAGEVNVMDNKMSSEGGYWNISRTWVAGTAISSRLITRDFIYNALHQVDRTERMVFEAYGNSTVDVSYDSDYSINPAAFHSEYAITLTAEYLKRYYFPDAVAEKIRFCFEASDYWSIRWLQPFAIATETINE